MSVRMYVSMYLCMHKYIYIRTCACIYTYMRTYMRTCMQAYISCVLAFLLVRALVWITFCDVNRSRSKVVIPAELSGYRLLIELLRHG